MLSNRENYKQSILITSYGIFYCASYCFIIFTEDNFGTSYWLTIRYNMVINERPK